MYLPTGENPNLTWRFKDTSMMTADEAAASVQTIIEAVSTFPEAPPNFQFEAAFRMAYNLALHRYSEMLYGALEKFFCERAREMIPREDFRMCAIMTRDVTMYMDRTYVASHKRTPVYDMAMNFYDARVPRALAHCGARPRTPRRKMRPRVWGRLHGSLLSAAAQRREAVTGGFRGGRAATRRWGDHIPRGSGA